MSSLSHQDSVRRGSGPAVPVIMRLPDLHQRAALKTHDHDSERRPADPHDDDPSEASHDAPRAAEAPAGPAWKATLANWGAQAKATALKHPRYTIGGVSALVALGVWAGWSPAPPSPKADPLDSQTPAVVQLGPETTSGATRKSVAPSILSPIEPKQTLVAGPATGGESQPPSVIPPPDAAPRPSGQPAGAAPLATSAPRKPGVARLTGKIIDRDNAPIEARHEPNRQGLY